MAMLTAKDVEKVAKLSNLKLTTEEVKKFTPQLSEVVDYFEELKKVDTVGVEPTSQTTGLVNKTRDDVVEPERILTAEQALSGTEETHNNYFKVPSLLNKDDI